MVNKFKEAESFWRSLGVDSPQMVSYYLLFSHVCIFNCIESFLSHSLSIICFSTLEVQPACFASFLQGILASVVNTIHARDLGTKEPSL